MKKLFICFMLCIVCVMSQAVGASEYSLTTVIDAQNEIVYVYISDSSGEPYNGMQYDVSVYIDGATEKIFSAQTDNSYFEIPMSDMQSGAYLIEVEFESGEVATIAFRYTTIADEMAFINQLVSVANQGGCDEFKAYFDANSQYWEDKCRFSEYYIQESQDSQICCYIPRLMEQCAYKDYLDRYQDYFDEAFFLGALNAADSLSEKEDILLSNADYWGMRPEFEALPDQSRVIKKLMSGIDMISTVGELRSRVDDLIAEMETSSGGGGISAGGGSGGGGKYNIYITDSNGEPFAEQPSDGENVKVIVNTYYDGQPSLEFAVGIYDSMGALKTAGVFKSAMDAQNVAEFWELDAVYDSCGTIKVLELEGVDTMKLLDEVMQSGFYCYHEAVPDAEPEEEGLTAIKGNVMSVSGGSFELFAYEMRRGGYWFGLGEKVDIECTGLKPYGYAYASGYIGEDVIYYVENTGEGYKLAKTNVDDKLVCFGRDDIISIASDKMSIMLDGVEKTYELEPTISFDPVSFFIYDDNYYFVAYLSDSGRIMAASAVNFGANKVIAVSDEMVTFVSGTAIEIDSIHGDVPKVGEVAIFDPRSSNIHSIARCESGYATEDGIKIGDKVYPSPRFMFQIGEPCRAYFDPYGTYICYAEVDYSEYTPVMVTAVTNEKVITTDGEIQISGEYTIDGSYKLDVEQFGCWLMEQSLPIALYWCEGENGAFVRQMARIEFTGKKYSALTNSIAGNLFDDKTQVFARVGEDIIPNASLKNGNRYSGVIFLDYNDEPLYVIVDDPYAQTVTEEKWFVLAEYGDEKVKGYIDGELVEFSVSEFDVAVDERSESVGSIYFLKMLLGELKEARLKVSLSTESGVASDAIFFGYVENMKGNIVVVGERAALVTADTVMYLVEEQRLTPQASLGNIVCNPVNGNSSYITVLTDMNDIAKLIVIRKN